MKFFFPDSQDLVDPSFDFATERRSPDRMRQRDDHYAHETFSTPVYDGLLVSKAIVEGVGSGTGKYTIAQRQRLLRIGAKEFFRIEDRPLTIMGDCGAFSYVREETPPFSTDDVLNFYDGCDFDFGVSVDHVILDYNAKWDSDPSAVPAPVRARRELTIQLAAEFLSRHKKRRLRFTPLGVAQGWSPQSYRDSVAELQKIGYRYIALGGMVPLKTPDILASLKEIAAVRSPKTLLHLFGVTRTESVLEFARWGVASFDSTSPLRQSFKDDKDNYYSHQGNYIAVRVPQTDANPSLARRIRGGIVDHDRARALERKSLSQIAQYENGECPLEEVLSTLLAYQELFDPSRDFSDAYRRALVDRPWRKCPCEVCEALGHHVLLFRGAERNRRRGFHNLYVFYNKLKQYLAHREHANAEVLS